MKEKNVHCRYCDRLFYILLDPHDEKTLAALFCIEVMRNRFEVKHADLANESGRMSPTCACSQVCKLMMLITGTSSTGAPTATAL